MNTTLPLSKIKDEWLEQMSCRAITRRDYSLRIEKFYRWCALSNVDPRDVSSQDIIDYRNYLSKYSAHYANALLVAVRMYYRFCASKNYWPDITRNVKGYQVEAYGYRDPLTAEQERALCAYVGSGTSERELRDRVIVYLMLFAGLRACEVSRANVIDVDSKYGKDYIYLQRKGRSDKDEGVYLAKIIMDALEDYLSARKNYKAKDPLVSSMNRALHGRPSRLSSWDIENIVRRAMKDAGVTGRRLTPHSLRHTFGTRLILAGTTTRQVQLLMGHRQIETTGVYVRAAEEMQLVDNMPIERMVENLGLCNKDT